MPDLFFFNRRFRESFFAKQILVALGLIGILLQTAEKTDKQFDYPDGIVIRDSTRVDMFATMVLGSLVPSPGRLFSRFPRNPSWLLDAFLKTTKPPPK
jgi:hypothetical protein